MSWKDELITSEQEALSFLQRALEEHQIETEIDLTSTVDPYLKSKDYKLVMIDKNGEAGERSVVFGAEFKADPHTHILTISNYVVSPAYYYNKSEDPYVGKDIGSIGLKALIGCANEYVNPIVNIHLREIQGDGSSFWPYFGAIPSAGVSFSSRKLNQILLQQLSYYEGEEFQQLYEIAELAQEYPALAYQELSQIRHNPFKRMNSDKVSDICRKVIKDIFKGTCTDDMTINLRDDRTREILRTRLGELPLEPAPPYLCWGCFSEVALEVAKRSGDSAFIKDFENYRDETWRRYPLSMAGGAIPWNL